VTRGERRLLIAVHVLLDLAGVGLVLLVATLLAALLNQWAGELGLPQPAPWWPFRELLIAVGALIGVGVVGLVALLNLPPARRARP
jgi:hypothetical protein